MNYQFNHPDFISQVVYKKNHTNLIPITDSQ